MKFCFVAYKFGTEAEIGQHLGTYHYFIEKTRTLVKKGHQVYVVCPWVSWTKKGSTEIDGVKVIRYWPLPLNTIWLWPLNKLVRFWYFEQTQRQVLKIIKEKKADLVYVWQAREAGYAMAQIKEKLGVPFIFRQITAWHWHFQRPVSEIFGQQIWYQKLKSFDLQSIVDPVLEFLLDRKSQMKYAKAIYQKADKIVFLSQAAIKESLELGGLNQTKTAVLGIAIEEDIFKPLTSKLELRQSLKIKGNKVILFIGRINLAEKGIGYLLQAMPQIISAVPDVNLVIIGGGGEEQQMKQMITDLKIEKNVQLVGKKPFQELPKYINAADVMVVPSVWMEAFGHVTIQGMSCGVPVITSDAGASPEINIDGQTGFVVPVKNSDAIAQAGIKILTNSQLQSQLGRTARQRVLTEYTYKAITDKFLAIIK